MSVKTPVIATRVGAVKEVLDKKTGTLIPPENKSHLIAESKKIC